MPIHDWTRVKAGIYHNFHYRWLAAIMDRLNAGLLPAGFFAMAEQIIGGPETDVVTHLSRWQPPAVAGSKGGAALAVAKPRTRFVVPLDAERYARKAHHIAIRHELGEVVAVIEIVSPGNKDRLHSLTAFVDKAVGMLFQGVNLLIIDPFPPGRFDPHGIPDAIGGGFGGQPFELPTDKRLTLAAYQAYPTITAYIEVVAVGDPLPDMPLYLYDEHHIFVPLEETYQTTWQVLPREIRTVVEPAPTS